MHNTEIYVMALSRDRELATSQRRMEQGRHLEELDAQGLREGHPARLGFLNSLRRLAAAALRGRRLRPVSPLPLAPIGSASAQREVAPRIRTMMQSQTCL
jgi:hypothetical protein